jgi:L-ascorbate metabolism protein UlaG (beta-lactamase superfamily)
MEITYYGHSCFLFNIGDIRVLFDPFITPNPLASEINIENIHPDYILLSHGHADHIADAEILAKVNDAMIISSFEITEWFEKRGVKNLHPMNIGGRVHFEFGSVKMVNAIHSNSLPDGTYGGQAAGFVIESAEKTFYYAGDTALTLDMKLIGEQFKIDFALLPIGDNFTMDIRDAMQAASYVNTKKVIGMHYDTFPFIEIDQVAVDMIAKRSEKELILMEIGQTITI